MLGDSDQPDQPGTEDSSGDLEYDLAHEGEMAARDAPPSREPANEDHVQVATQTPGFDSDYGYDLAHDVPAQD